MKKTLALILVVMLLIAAVPATALAATVYISSTGSGTINLRSGPGKDYGVKGYVSHGQSVTKLDSSGEWSKVKTSSGKVGWIKTKYIDGTTKSLGTGYKTVNSGGETLNLRSGPGTSYSVKGKVSSGAKVKVLNTEDDWVKVTVSSSGKTGWIKAKYIGAGSSSGGSSSSGGGSSNGGSSGGTVSVWRVTGASVNVRKGAGTGYGVVATLSSGTKFKSTGSSGNWLKITTFSGVTGWVSKSYVTSGASATVTANSLNMRKGAGTGYGVVKSLSKGAVVTVTSIVGGWAKVTSGGTSGYVSANYLKF